MFKITGKLNGEDTSVTWDDGHIDHKQLAKIVINRTATETGPFTDASQQEVIPSLTDPFFCYLTMIEYFDNKDEVEVEGDIGLITFDIDGIVY